MSEWVEMPLCELGSIERGRSRHRPRNDPKLFGDEMPFFQTGDVKAASLHMTAASWSYSDFGVSQSRVWKPGTTCITIAANIADTAVLGVEGCFPDSVLGFTPRVQPSDAYFVKYLLDVAKTQLSAAARGTTQDNLSLEKLSSYRFLVPGPETRARITYVLRSFDELIESNRRRIEILDEMARLIYREWFVHFRFPGREEIGLVNSDLGLVPESWTVGEVGDVLYLQRGFDLPMNSRNTAGNVPVLAASGTHGYHDERRVAGPGVVTGRSGTIGAVTYVQEDFWPLNTVLWVKEYRRSSPVHAYYFLESLGLAGLSSGAAVPTLNRNHVHAIRVPVPPEDLVSEYDLVASPMFELRACLDRQNHVLAEARDLLLPRLVSGELDVSKLDLDFEVVA